MPAGIEEFDHMVSTGGKVPWHGLGTTLPNESLDSKETLEYAHLAGWDLQKVPLYAGNPDDGFMIVPGRYGIKRGLDNVMMPAAVGEAYTLFSNEDAFSWFDELLGEGFHYITAGSLGGGTTVWILAKAPFKLELPDSQVDFFTLLKTGHDGGSSIQALNTPVRVVCKNTLGAALSGANRIIRVAHTVNHAERLRMAMTYLGYTEAARAELERKAHDMAATSFSDADWANLCEKLFPIPEEDGRARTLARKAHSLLNEEYAKETDTQGTAWGAWNAVVAYNDHRLTHRARTATAEENRFSHLMFANRTLSDKAFELLGVK